MVGVLDIAPLQDKKLEIQNVNTRQPLSELLTDAERRRPKKRLIIVLGMHRSGTSAVARSLQSFNVALGDRLIAGVEGDNDKGFWEDADIQSMNERILGKLGSAWDRISAIDHRRLVGSEFSSERIDARLLLERKLEGRDDFSFKDPRTAVLVPFWRCVVEDLELESQFVIVVRNPLETAASLHRRNGFDQVKSLMLWLKHMNSAVQFTNGMPRVFVRYEALLARPLEQLERISRATMLPMPQEQDPSLKSFLNDFLDEALYRNRISDSELARSYNVPKLLEEYFRLVSSWCQADTVVLSKDEKSIVSKVSVYLQEADPTFSYLDRANNAISSLQKELARNSEERQSLLLQSLRIGDQLEQTQLQLDASELELSSARAELVVSAASLSEARGEAENVREELSRTRLQLDASELELSSARTELDVNVVLLSEARGEVDSLNEALVRAHAELNQARDILRLSSEEKIDLYQRIASLEKSLHDNIHLSEAASVFAQSKLDDAIESLAKSEAERRDLVDAMRLLEEQLCGLQFELSCKMGGAIAADVKYSNRLAGVTSALAEAEREIQSLAVSAHCLEFKLASMEADFFTVQSERELLGQQLKLFAASNGDLQAKLDNALVAQAEMCGHAISRSLELDAAKSQLGRLVTLELQCSIAKSETIDAAREQKEALKKLSIAAVELRLCRARIQALESSRIWRWTKPIRKLSLGNNR